MSQLFSIKEAAHLLLEVFSVKVKGERSFSQRHQEKRYSARVTLSPVPTYHLHFSKASVGPFPPDATV